MDPIIRQPDGTLVVTLEPDRHADEGAANRDEDTETGAAKITLHPGEGGYDAALAEWDRQQHDGHTAVSTATGRDEAMAVVHHLADDPRLDLSDEVGHMEDPDASADALRHVLVGGVHSVEDFAAEVADHEGGEVLPPHQMTKLIGQVLAEIDS